MAAFVAAALSAPATGAAGTPLTQGACTVTATGAGDSCEFVVGSKTLGYTGMTDTGWSITHVRDVDGQKTTVVDDSGGSGGFTRSGGVLREGITYTLHVDGNGTGAAGVDPDAQPGVGDGSRATSIRSYDPCTATSWTAGTVDYCKGVLQYHDYVYDDYGANDGSSPSQSWGQVGTQRYPVGDEASADISGVDLWVADGRLHVRFDLSALYRPDETVAALAIDTDDDRQTGGGQWGDLGVSSKGWDTLATFDSGDVASRTISGSVPLPAGSRWRVQAVTARKGGPVMNAAFRGPDETGSWFDANQAGALAAGDVSDFGYEVDVADLLDGATRAAPDPEAGRHERVYTSDYTIGRGQGYDYTGIAGRGGGSPLFPMTYQFFGRLQPYGVYIPPGAGTYNLLLWLHPLSGVMTPAPYGGMASTMGDAHHRILMTPLGRGQNGFYSDYSERDVLDALDDLERTYPVDDDHVLVGGYSMGGYGALRMAALYPDRFAGYMQWVGFTGEDQNGFHPFPDGPNEPIYYPAGAIGNVADLAGNLRYVPGASLYGSADELVHVWTTEIGLRQAFEDAKIPFVLYQHPTAEHFTFAVVGGWQKETAYTANLGLVHDPPRVTFRTARFMFDDALGIRQDRAYWVSGIDPASARRYADVDLTTHACGGSLPVVTEGLPGAGPSPVPWISHSASVTGQQPIAAEPKLTGRLGEVSKLTVDADRTCLAGKSLSYDVASDVPVDIALSDGRTIHLDGSGEQSGTLPAPKVGATVADPTGGFSGSGQRGYFSASVDTSYQTYRRDEPEVQFCDGRDGGLGYTWLSSGGNGPADAQQGSSYAGHGGTCAKSDPQTGAGG